MVSVGGFVYEEQDLNGRSDFQFKCMLCLL